MKTFSARSETVEHGWYVVDAAGRPLGRLASEVAKRLRGKHKPIYTPHVDTGDYIVVINAARVGVTGNKRKQKLYHRHSGYPGGLRSVSLERMLDTHPTRVVEHAVKGMLPKGPLGRDMFRKLRVYPGADHEHHAQRPETLTL